MDATFYVFELSQMAGATPYGKTTDGGIAAFFFTAPDRALRYAASRGHSTDWRVRELSAFDAMDWLQVAKETNGVTTVWKDPDPHEEGHRELPLDVLLRLLDAACRR